TRFSRDWSSDVCSSDLEFLGAVHEVKDLGRAQERLGRDAAPVQADAAQMLALDTGHLQPQLRAADGTDIAARAGTDHHHVEALRHGNPPIRKDSSALNHFSELSKRQLARDQRAIAA